MKTHRILIAALCLAPMLGACELIVDYDRTKIVADGGGADMSMPPDMNMPTDMNTDMPPTDMPVIDMDVPDMPLEDMDVPDMPGVDLGPADLGTDGGPADLGTDGGPADLGPMCPASCADTNPCTDDSCNAGTGLCEHVANTDSCSDGNACTVGDVCAASACVPGPVNCAAMDGDCVVGVCNAGTCETMNRPDTTPCGTAMMCMTGVCT